MEFNTHIILVWGIQPHNPSPCTFHFSPHTRYSFLYQFSRCPVKIILMRDILEMHHIPILGRQYAAVHEPPGRPGQVHDNVVCLMLKNLCRMSCSIFHSRHVVQPVEANILTQEFDSPGVLVHYHHTFPLYALADQNAKRPHACEQVHHILPWLYHIEMRFRSNTAPPVNVKTARRRWRVIVPALLVRELRP